MNEKDLNIEYICEKTLLVKDDELVPIILDLMQESYRAGLCQAEYDNTMNLIEENQELKKKYENAVADYETTMFEKEQLNSLVNSCQEEIRQLKKQVETYKKLGFKYLQDKNNNLETQQKEFIKYLELEKDCFVRGCSNVYEDSLGKTRLVNEDIFDEIDNILQKYREIIGGKE